MYMCIYHISVCTSHEPLPRNVVPVSFIQVMEVLSDRGATRINVHRHFCKHRRCAYAVLVVDNVAAAEADRLLERQHHRVPMYVCR